MSTDIFIELVTNRTRFPNAPKYLPKYLLIKKKILSLRKNSATLKYETPHDDVVSLLLYEPWRNPEDITILEMDLITVEEAKMRRKLVFPCCDM